MIRLKRLQSVALLALGLAGALVLCNLMLLAAMGSQALPLQLEERQFSWRPIAEMNERVAGLEVNYGYKQRIVSEVEPPPPLGIILGQSTVFRGLDPQLLPTSRTHPDANLPSQWVLLNGFGMSFDKVATFAQPLLQSHIRPHTVIIGIHPAMAVGEQLANLRKIDAPFRVEDVLPEATSASRYPRINWVQHHRDLINFRTRQMLYTTKLAMHSTLDHGTLALAQPAADPFTLPQRQPLPIRAPEENLERQMTIWEMYGWFSDAAYHPQRNQNEIFTQLIRDMRNRFGPKTKIIILIMPESPELRTRLPRIAQTNLAQLLQQLHEQYAIQTINFNSAMPPQAFSDHVHLNTEHVEAFSERAGELLVENEVNSLTPKYP